MPTLVINDEQCVPASQIPIGHIAKTSDTEVLCYRSREHMVFFTNNTLLSVKECVQKYIDLGVLIIQKT